MVLGGPIYLQIRWEAFFPGKDEYAPNYVIDLQHISGW